MKNAFEIKQDITVIKLFSPKFGHLETIIDTCDLPKVKDFPNTWYPTWREDSKTWYVVGKIKKQGKSKAYLLHREITGCPKGFMVDHLDHNGLNNRQSNMRIVTNAQNQQNRKGASINNKSSGIRGVCWDKSRNKWMATITVNKTTKNLGRFDTLEQAKAMVFKARKKYMPYSELSILEQPTN